MASESKMNRTTDARENASDQVAIGFGLTSDWLRDGREFAQHRAS